MPKVEARVLCIGIFDALVCLLFEGLLVVSNGPGKGAVLFRVVCAVESLQEHGAATVAGSHG